MSQPATVGNDPQGVQVALEKFETRGLPLPRLFWPRLIHIKVMQPT